MITRRALPLLLAAPALAQAGFPTRPVRIVVPYPPGGGVDAMARALSEPLSRAWGQPVSVDNRPGGATVPGTDHVARAAPDGHVLLLTSDSSITSNPHLYRSMPSDPVRDLAPVALLTEVHQAVIVHPSVPARDLAGLIAAARAAPGRMNYGSYGTGSQPQLLFETLKAEARIDIAHIPYRGLAPAVQAAVAGEVQMTLAGLGIAGGQVAGGTLRALAIGRPTRLPQWPEVQTLREAGFDHADPRTWFGLFAPAGVPAGVLAQIRRDVAAAMAEPGFAERHVTARGMTGRAGDGGFAEFIAADLEAKGRMIRQAGIERE